MTELEKANNEIKQCEEYVKLLKRELNIYKPMPIPVFSLCGSLIRKHGRALSSLLPNIKNLDNGEEIGKEFKTKAECVLYLEELMSNEDEYLYADNMRHCSTLDYFQLDEYLLAYRKGCCGFYDELVYVNPTLNEENHNINYGEPFLVGFNYNH
jgi:hypothetical protein